MCSLTLTRPASDTPMRGLGPRDREDLQGRQSLCEQQEALFWAEPSQCRPCCSGAQGAISLLAATEELSWPVIRTTVPGLWSGHFERKYQKLVGQFVVLN